MSQLAKTIYETQQRAPAAKYRAERFRYNIENARILVEGLKEAGINFVTTLPDSLNHYLNKYISEDKAFEWIVATREDEAVAIASGAQLGGKRPCVVMEASGYGMAANCIARLNMLQRIPLLFITSHVPGLGEAWGYHSETRYMNPIVDALQIPHHVISDISLAKKFIRQAQLSIEGQKVPVALFIPTYIYFEEV